MRFDLILLAGIPVLALLLLGLNRAREPGWVLKGLWGVVLLALAGLGIVFLVLSARPTSPAPLEPFSVAVACFLTGGLVLWESLKPRPGAPGIPCMLAGAAAAFAIGAAAAMLALLSRGPAGWLGLLAAYGHPTVYALSILGGLFVAYALLDATKTPAGTRVWHLAIAACGWVSVARSLAATPDGPFLPAMVALFVAAAGLGTALRLAGAERVAQTPPPD